MTTFTPATRPPLSTPIDSSDPATRHCGYITNVPSSNAVSLYYLFKQGGLQNHPTRPMLGWRKTLTTVDGSSEASEYLWRSYSEVNKIVLRVARGLKRLGVGKGDHVGIYGKNCASWVAVGLGISCVGGVVVPLYGSLGVGSVKYVCGHSGVKVVFCEESVLGKLWEAIGGEGDEEGGVVEKVVVFGGEGFVGGDRDVVEKVCGGNERVVGLEEVLGDEDVGEEEVEDKEVGLEDLHCVMYTSGTTGTPKGVMLKNLSLIRCVEASREFFGFWGTEITESDVIMSYLPLAHIYEQTVEATIFYVGAAVGFFRGNPKLLLDDMLALKPTLFPGVPRVFARFQEKIESAVEKGGWVAKTLFRFAYNMQVDNVRNLRGRNSLLDLLVFNKIRDKILPNARVILTSAAPMSAQTMDFLRVTLNAPVIQGFGLTESCGPALIEAPNNSVSGGTGGPLPYCQVKLKDVPEMEYFSTDDPPRGEMYLKGPMIMAGYYKRDQETTECFPENDGWFATGDIGRWREDGGLEIIDRKKNLFKLAQGEYISPETLEQEYGKCKSISQIWVYGNSFYPKLVAIVVPEIWFAEKWAKSHGVTFESLSQIAEREDFKGTVLAELLDMNKASNFKGYERIEDIRFETGVNDVGQGFTIEKELLTPTLKLKRPVLKKRYNALLDEMYGEK